MEIRTSITSHSLNKVDSIPMHTVTAIVGDQVTSLSYTDYVDAIVCKQGMDTVASMIKDALERVTHGSSAC